MPLGVDTAKFHVSIDLNQRREPQCKVSQKDKTYQNRMNEPNRAFTSPNTRFVDKSQDRAPNRRGEGCSAHQPPRPIGANNLAITHSTDIRVCTPTVVVNTACNAAEVAILNEMVIPTEAKGLLHLIKVGRNSIALVIWDSKDIGEATAARKSSSSNLVQFLAWGRRDRGVEAVPFCTAD